MGRVYGWTIALAMLAIGLTAGKYIATPEEQLPPAQPTSFPPAVITVPAEHPTFHPETVDARALGQTFVQIAKKVNPAVVSLSAVRLIAHPSVDEEGDESDGFRGPFERFFNAPDEVLRHSVGSGVIVDGTNGYILTNHHVVENATGIQITLFDNRVLQGTLVGGDEKTDLAVVRADIPDGVLPHAVLGDSDALEVGEWIVAVGNPFGLSHTVTAGIVSGRGRVLNRENYEDFIQTDAAINPGNSGGPVINMDGHVVGISTAIASNSGYFQGAGFAIPINMARQVMGQLIRYGYVTRGYIGIRMATVTTEEATELGIDKGVLIRRIERNTPAESAGLKAGDVIVALQGEEVAESIQFRNKVASLSPGTSITLQVWRDRTLEDIHLTLGALPSAVRPQKAAARPTKRTLGIVVEPLDATENEYVDKTGVLVSEVKRGSEAFRFGVRAGVVILQVNDTPISSVAEYHRVMASVTSGEILMFLIRRGMDNPSIISITKP